MTPAKIAGVFAGLTGVAVLVGLDALGTMGGNRGGDNTAWGGGVWGQFACLGAALSYAFAGVYGRRFKSMGVAPLQAAAGQVTASLVLILPIVAIAEPPWLMATTPSFTTWSALAGLALLSTALAYLLYFRILAAAGTTNLLLVTFLVPVTAILLGASLLDERLEPQHLAGMALIGAGLAAIDSRVWRRSRPAKRPAK